MKVSEVRKLAKKYFWRGGYIVAENFSDADITEFISDGIDTAEKWIELFEVVKMADTKYFTVPATTLIPFIVVTLGAIVYLSILIIL